MVFQDISSHVELNKIGQVKSTAQMVDRFFSFVLDYLIISPFVMFALYSAFSNGFRFWKTNPTASENELFVVIIGVCFVVLFALIQTFFVSLWDATPGQYFLKIKFEYDDHGSTRLLKVFFRQVLFWFSFLFLAIPLLSVLTNAKRRTFYDQIAEVTVVSTKSENFTVGFENEFKYWRALMATLTLFLGFLFAAFLMQNYNKIKNRVVSFNEFKSKNFFCAELNDVAQKDRLPVAIGLNLVNQLSDACLDREADFVFWRLKETDTSLAYFAKSLTADSKEKEKIYLAQACEGRSPTDELNTDLGCQIAWHFKEAKFEELYAKLNSGNFLSDVLKYELSLILNKAADKKPNFAALKSYSTLKPVKKYRLSELLEDVFTDSVDPVMLTSISITPESEAEFVDSTQTLVSRELSQVLDKAERAPSSAVAEKIAEPTGVAAETEKSKSLTDDEVGEIFNLLEEL